MSFQQFQAAHNSIHSTGTRLLQYFQEVWRSGLSEGEQKGLHSIEEDITKALDALKDQKYQVAVIAAMKAGKSTFLNAVIGADVLASETAACTVCRTDIRHINVGQVPRLLEYREGNPKKPIVLAEGNPEEIRQKFLDSTHKIRSPLNPNPDKTIRFELEHSIEAINGLSSLVGFTLVDTPGPNELQSVNFKPTVALKQAALEALRTCNAVLFVLDYTSYRDNAVEDFFKEVIQNRQELLGKDKGKIYFILNKVDQKGETDPEIAEVIESLRLELDGFGFPNPSIYPASARQGLLAKLIKQGKATESQIIDFDTKFGPKYAERNERGRLEIPLPEEIAPKALEDSGVLTIQEIVISTITQNAGWNLLNDVVAKLDKAAKAIEDTLSTRIRGWEMELETLKQKVEEFRKSSEFAKRRVESVKEAVNEQKQILIKGFSQGVSIFSENAKAKIQDEIDRIAESRSASSVKLKVHRTLSTAQRPNDVNWGEILGEIGEAILDVIPGIGKGLGKIFRIGVRAGESLLNALVDAVPEPFDSHDFVRGETEVLDPYKIRVKNKQEAEKIGRTINEFCAPHIQSWWLDTQDKLVRDGTEIRKELTKKLQIDIQKISDELSNKIGYDLQVKLNVNPIQFPDFDFLGIDAQIQYQQEVIQRTERIQKVESRPCNQDKIYYVDVPIEEKRSVFEVDLHQIAEAIKQKINEQSDRSEQLLQRIIQKQVLEDFRSAEQQINDYIKRFQADFECLLREREIRGTEDVQIREVLKTQKAQLTEHLSELVSIRESLESWRPGLTIS